VVGITLNERLKKIVADMAEVAGYLWQKGWAARNGGNISVDVTESVHRQVKNWERFPTVAMNIKLPELAGRSFLVTTTGSRFRELAREPQQSLLLVHIADKLDGYRILWGGTGPESRPTAEFVSHLKIHALLRQTGAPQMAVLHSHPGELIALTHMEDYGREIFQRFLRATEVSARFFLPEGVGMAPYQAGGSEELADATVALFRRHKAVLWEKHGCTTIGVDASDAFDLMDLLNSAAQVFLLCKAAGYEPKGLNWEQLAELKKGKGSSS
jgi:rhamnulose-1-phosphate aldolase